MPFNPKRCVIPIIWCGKSRRLPRSNDPRVKYTRKGKPIECMRRGFGAGVSQARKATLNENSLQHIRYIGEHFDANFRREGIRTVRTLVNRMAGMTSIEKAKLLKRVFTRRDGSVDGRGYNSTILYLYGEGVTRLPICKALRV